MRSLQAEGALLQLWMMQDKSLRQSLFSWVKPFTKHHRLEDKYKFINNQIQMHKNKYYRAPKPATLPQRQSSKPRPEWTTDFVDTSKYKLSQAEMIQRKAALQSKNRQSARQELEERRRKLEMGIVDEDTRKVYETALISKNIDLNPSVRRNLSQMIQYERQKQQQQAQKGDQEPQNQEQEGDLEGEIKRTGNFIKKLEKARKEENIEKAVDILMVSEKKSSHFGPTKKKEDALSHLNNLKQSEIKESSHDYSCEETLSNIEDTIKFMEEKLFNPNWRKSQQAQKSAAPLQDKTPAAAKKQSPKKLPMNNFIAEQDEDVSREISYNEFLADKPHTDFTKFKLNLEEQHQEEDECLSTIRRMKEMIEGHSDLYCPDPPRHRENFNASNFNHLKGYSTVEKASEGQPEVDFSLTMNQDDPSFKVQEHKDKWLGGMSGYEELKKNLFEEADKLQSYNFSYHSESTIPHASPQYEDEVEEKPQPAPQPMAKKKKGKAGSMMGSEFEQIKSLLEGSQKTVSRLQVESMGVGKSGVMGFDFRGSINIQRHVVGQM